MTKVIQRADGPYQGAKHPILPENSPQDSPKDMVQSVLQVHETHLDWLSKLLYTLKDPAEGVQLVHSSTPRMKTALVLLNLSFNYPTAPPLSYP